MYGDIPRERALNILQIKLITPEHFGNNEIEDTIKIKNF